MAQNRKTCICLLAVLIVITFFIGWLITKQKIIAYEYNHHFFPRSDLNSIYNNSYHLADDAVSNATGIQNYYQQLRKSTIIGTAYYTPSSEYILGFDMFKPELQNEKVNILFDSGKIKFDSPLPNKTQTLFFDICAFTYNDADLFNKHLVIQNGANQESFILGYLCTVYISPLGRIKSNYIPLDTNVITVNTKDRQYFLKEFCIFSVYKHEAYVLQNEVLYQINVNDDKICNFTIQRPNYFFTH